MFERAHRGDPGNEAADFLVVDAVKMISGERCKKEMAVRQSNGNGGSTG